MKMNRPTVLILSSDPAFAREVTANWPRDGGVDCKSPEFIVLDPRLCRDFDDAPHGLVIADASADEPVDTRLNGKKDGQRKIPKNVGTGVRNAVELRSQAHDLKVALAAAGKPAIVINSVSAVDLYVAKGAIVELRREPVIWPAMAGLIGREILRRRQAESRSHDANQICAMAEAEATLGRYMLEMRTNVNNALTTMLGNAELLAQESGLPASVHAQADTIRNMALRLHEIFQRFSSLEKELTVAARNSVTQTLASTAGRG
jgi:hypothetical protein